MPTISAEILLAQKLAGNTQEIRDKAYRRLKIYLETKTKLDKTGTGGFSRNDLLKLWKGLHFSMWMQDKPLLQEQLSENITDLIPCFANQQAAREFIITYFITECREWDLLDKWRIDKFSMWFRDMFNATLRYMKIHKWGKKIVKPIMNFLSTYIIKDVDNKTAPSGLRYHLADVYFTELQNVCAGENDPRVSVALLAPWIEVLPIIKREQLRTTIIKEIFSEIVLQSPPLKGVPKVKVDYAAIAERFRLATERSDCRASNRKPLRALLQSFQAIAAGRAPNFRREPIPVVAPLTDDDIEAAAFDLAEFQGKLMAESRQNRHAAKRKIKPQQSQELDEAYESAGDSDDSRSVHDSESFGDSESAGSDELSDPEETDEPPAKVAKVNGAGKATKAANPKTQTVKDRAESSSKTPKEKPTKETKKGKGRAIGGDPRNQKVLEKMRTLIKKDTLQGESTQKCDESEEDSDVDILGGPDMDDLPSDDDDFDINDFLGEGGSDKEDLSDIELDGEDTLIEGDDDVDFMDAEEYEKLIKSQGKSSSKLPLGKCNKKSKNQTKEKKAEEIQQKKKPLKKRKVKNGQKPLQKSTDTSEVKEDDIEEMPDLVPIVADNTPKRAKGAVTGESEKSTSKVKAKKLKKKSKAADVSTSSPSMNSQPATAAVTAAETAENDEPLTNGDVKIRRPEGEPAEKVTAINQNNSNSSAEGILQSESKQKTKKMKKGIKQNQQTLNSKQPSESPVPNSAGDLGKRKAKAAPSQTISLTNGVPTKKSSESKSGKSNCFEVEDFPESSLACLDTENLLAPALLLSVPSKKLKKMIRNRSKSAGDAEVNKLAHFTKTSQTPPNATVFRKASKKGVKSPTISSALSTPQSGKKRISFGGNSAVKKTALKLRGSESHDPNRTPEQGILRVNPIEPGTVIQVGKEATIRNTLENSKFPSRMMSSGMYYV